VWLRLAGRTSRLRGPTTVIAEVVPATPTVGTAGPLDAVEQQRESLPLRLPPGVQKKPRRNPHVCVERRRARPRRHHSAPRSLIIAVLSGFFTLIQSRDGPERRAQPLRHGALEGPRRMI
jgi:hypothetical protein